MRSRPLVTKGVAMLSLLVIASCERAPKTSTLSESSATPPPAATVAPAPISPAPTALLPATPAPQPTTRPVSYTYEPPEAWRDQFGPYRSPLLRYDGTQVARPEDWPARREEIRQRWIEMLGSWPPLAENPPCDVLESKTENGTTEKHLRIDLPPRQTISARLLIPPGDKPHPAVLVLSADSETAAPNAHSFGDMAQVLTARGFVTLTIGPPGGNPRKPEMDDVECQPLMYLAYIGAVCANVLTHTPEVDASKIAVVGHAYGGKWAMFASCFCDRFACAVWSEAGIIFDERKASANYHDPWYLGLQIGDRRIQPRREDERGRVGAYGLLYHAGLNLQELHALMAPRPFLVAAGSNRRPSLALICADDETRWTVLNHSIAVNRLLGFEHRVAMSNRPAHDVTPEAKEDICRFLEECLSGSDR